MLGCEDLPKAYSSSSSLVKSKHVLQLAKMILSCQYKGLTPKALLRRCEDVGAASHDGEYENRRVSKPREWSVGRHGQGTRSTLPRRWKLRCLYAIFVSHTPTLRCNDVYQDNGTTVSNPWELYLKACRSEAAETLPRSWLRS